MTSSRNHDLWVVPGGGVEPGEEPETSAAREANEEVCFKYNPCISTSFNLSSLVYFVAYLIDTYFCC